MKMKTFLKLITAVAVFTLQPASVTRGPADSAGNSTAGPIAKGQRIFFCGHSFHFQVPTMLDEMAKTAGVADQVTAGKSMIGGSKVIRHWEVKDESNEAKKALQAGAVDVLTMTPIYLPDDGIEKFAQLGLEHNPNFRAIVQEFWLPFDQYEPRFYDPPRIPQPKQVDHNAATAEGLRKMHQRYFREMDEHISALNRKLGKQTLFVAPVGQAVIALREKIIAGEAPGLKEQEDLFTDPLGHAKGPLWALVTYCHYAVIYRKSPVGLPIPQALAQQTHIPAGDREKLNRLLQELAWNAVTHHPLSGVAAANVSDVSIQAGQVGRTSYVTLPFVSEVSQVSWGASSGMTPTILHWESGTHFTDASLMKKAQGVADGLRAKGIVPFNGAQRWQDTYMAALPPVAGEPRWVTSSRNNSQMASREDYKAWVAWQKAHSNLFMLNANGEEAGKTVGAWFGSWGHISPLMPLPKADWPAGRTNVTYGEWFAYKIGQTAHLSGANAIMLSDFSDSQPHLLSYQTGFNPEIIAAFEESIGRTIPGTSIAEKSKYINANLYSQWTDYLCKGYAKFFGQLAAELTSNTGHDGLVLNQGSRWPSILRLYGVDDRIIARTVPRKNFHHFGWDGITMDPPRDGKSMIWGIGGMVIAAAREPDIRFGGNLSADNSAFWRSVVKFWGNNDPALVNDTRLTSESVSADLRERGLKELKRAWLETSWAHIADRQGNTRRALCSMSRYYWDGGKLDQQTRQLIQTVVPSRPFGFAVYYSVPVERRVEVDVPSKGSSAAYFNPDILMNFKNGGGVVNYYVSDAGLPNLKTDSRPAAWLVLDRANLLPAAERKQLESIAPILTSLDEARNFPNPPLAFSHGLTGSGFYDQQNRLIITVTSPSPAGVAINGAITLNGLAAGAYVATEQFSQARISFSVTEGKAARIPVQVSRWDTLVFVITPDAKK